jgi:hypothetical protein
MVNEQIRRRDIFDIGLGCRFRVHVVNSLIGRPIVCGRGDIRVKDDPGAAKRAE